jgi:ketosteroid isomerase-like protein
MVAELLRRAFDAFNRRDLDGLLALLAPDVRVHSLMTEPERAEYHGHQGVREWHAAIFEVFPDWCPEIRDIRELDEGAIVRFEAKATAATSGVRIEQTYWQAATVRDGLITFYGFYRREQDAREALGLGSEETPG